MHHTHKHVEGMQRGAPEAAAVSPLITGDRSFSLEAIAPSAPHLRMCLMLDTVCSLWPMRLHKFLPNRNVADYSHWPMSFLSRYPSGNIFLIHPRKNDAPRRLEARFARNKLNSTQTFINYNNNCVWLMSGRMVYAERSNQLRRVAE